MKRVISLALVICLVLLLLTPAAYALTLPDDLVALDLQDYFVKSYMKADYMVNEYLLYADSMVFTFKSASSLLDETTYSFTNSIGSTVYSNGFYVSYSDVPVGVDSSLNLYDGNELFNASDIPVGAYLTFDFFFMASGPNISKFSYNLVDRICFFDISGKQLSVDCYDIYCSCCGVTYDDRSIATIIHNCDSSFSRLGNYKVSCYVPEGTAYFSIAFGCYVPYIYSGESFSFTAGSCTLSVEGTPYPTQPTISYNWSDTGAATYPLGTTTGVPLQVHVTNTQSYGSYSYQWYSGQFNKYDADHLYGYGTPIEGATSAVYMPPVDHLGTYWYYCVVGHTSGDNMAYTHTSDCLVTVVDPSTGGSGVDPTEPSDPSGGGGGTGTDPGGGSTDPTVPSSGGDSGGDTGGDSGGGSSDPTTSNDDVVAGIEESNNWLENIANGILNLPQTIMNGIKGLFIPDQAAMEAYADKWDGLLADRFGVVWESLAFVSDIVSVAYSPLSTIEVPSVTVNLAGTDFTFGGWVVDIIPDGFEFLTSYSKLAVSFVATLAFFNGMKKRLYDVMGIDFNSDAASWESYKNRKGKDVSS